MHKVSIETALPSGFASCLLVFFYLMCRVCSAVLGAFELVDSGQPLSLPLFVGSCVGATSDLGMAYDRARVLLQSDKHPGNSVAGKVGPCSPTFPGTVLASS